MFWLVFAMHLFIGTTLAGSAIIVALSIGMDRWQLLAGAAVAGYLLAIPIAMLVARGIRG